VTWARRRAGATGVLALVAAVAALSGCGRKAPPLPPVVQKPERVRDLTAFQEGGEAVLSWGYPQMTTAGGVLPPLETVEVWRLTLPADREPRGASAQELRVRRQLMEAGGRKLALLAGDAIDSATRGPVMELRDDLKRWHEEDGEAGEVIWYSVVSTCCGGKASEMSNIPRLVPQLPPSAPAGLTGETAPEGILVRWTLETELATLVERSPDGEAWERVTAEPVTVGEWLDPGVEQERTWHYRLRSVGAADEGARVVGESGTPISVDYPDLYPPPSPANLICLPEGELIRLRWDGVGEDVTFVVFRRLEGGEPEPVAEGLDATGYEDTAPLPGSWTYGVRSVDEAGNESEPATCSTVVGEAP